MNIVYGSELSTKIKRRLKTEIENLPKNRPPHLVVVLVGDNPASLSYIKGKQKACTEVGIQFTLIRKDADIKENELLNSVEELNQREDIDGILVQLPLPKHINERTVLEAVIPEKDIDGLTTYNMGKLFLQEEGYYPCTPLGVMEILKEMGVDLSGKHVVVIGRSMLVGLPLSRLLTAAHATVTVCHSKTENLQKIASTADVLVVAIGKPLFITKEYVKKDAYVIDVGVNRVGDKLCGDVDFENVKDHCKAITPVPKGVGPMTIAMLLSNTVEAYKKKVR